MSKAIWIADYDPEWPQMYEEARIRIAEALAEWLVAIEHVGSTSVPGLAAKPVIDIMPGIRTLDDAAQIVRPMEALGYEYVTDDAIPERLYFHLGRPVCLQHVHVVEAGSEFWRRHLLFRDYLRAHPEAAAEYAALKRRLAERFREDSLAYTDAKTDFILGTVETAAAAPSPSLPSAERGVPSQPASTISRSAE